MKKQSLLKSVSYAFRFIPRINKLPKKVLYELHKICCAIFNTKSLSENVLLSLRLLAYVTFFCCLGLSCDKELNSSFSDSLINQGFTDPTECITDPPFQKCIYSYNQLKRELKMNPTPVKSVVLYNGTVVSARKGILSITYKAIDLQESFSLFRSQIDMVYNFYGYQQENAINCWSLGCVYQNAGVPPFTAILKRNTVLLINTHFNWTIPGGNGRRIKYLIVD